MELLTTGTRMLDSTLSRVLVGTGSDGTFQRQAEDSLYMLEVWLGKSNATFSSGAIVSGREQSWPPLFNPADKPAGRSPGEYYACILTYALLSASETKSQRELLDSRDAKSSSIEAESEAAVIGSIVEGGIRICVEAD